MLGVRASSSSFSGTVEASAVAGSPVLTSSFKMADLLVGVEEAEEEEFCVVKRDEDEDESEDWRGFPILLLLLLLW